MFTSTKALLSPSILLLHRYVFYLLFHSFSISFPLLVHAPLSFTPLFTFTLLSLPSLCFTVYLSPITLCLFLLSSFFFCFALHQVPGQLHGRRQGRLHERKSSQRHAHHHPAQKVHGAHQDHLSTGQETQTGIASSDGGRRRPGQPTGRGRSGRSSVPRVRPQLLIFLHFCSMTRHLLSSASRIAISKPSAFIFESVNVCMCMSRCNTCCLICNLTVMVAVCSP